MASSRIERGVMRPVDSLEIVGLGSSPHDAWRLVHEIEWIGHPGEEARWIIEASDVQFRIVPLEAGQASADARMDVLDGRADCGAWLSCAITPAPR